jgi:hypothetical protein
MTDFLHRVESLTKLVDSREFEDNGRQFRIERLRWQSGDFTVLLFVDGTQVITNDFLEEYDAIDYFDNLVVNYNEYV